MMYNVCFNNEILDWTDDQLWCTFLFCVMVRARYYDKPKPIP